MSRANLEGTTGAGRSGGLALAVVLAAILGVRLIGLGQPIVENYVGRQVPTAMVARNLERGSGFLRPCLDVAPFPNLFLVEPPLFQVMVLGVRRLLGLPLEASGRLVSALGIVIGAWGVFDLTARRSGRLAGLAAALAFGTFPLTIRYGRAFQPDALMIGGVVMGLACWDRAEERTRWRPAWLAAALVATSAGLACKVLAAHVLVPLWLVVARPRTIRSGMLVAATLLPAALWYLHAARLLEAASGSNAAADNGAVWWRVLTSPAVAKPETLALVARFLGFRAFTPLGLPLALVGLTIYRGNGRLWQVWGGSAALALTAVASKLHHEYYLLALAPVLAAGVGQCLAGLATGPRWRSGLTVGLGLAFLTLAGIQSRTTFQTPPEWKTLGEVAEEARAVVPRDAWVVGSEAVLYATDRRGCRLEFTPAAARRAAAEWRGSAEAVEIEAVDGPIPLVEFARDRGARFFVDVGLGLDPETPDSARLALHEAVRHRYNVLVDRPGVLIAALGAPRPDPTRSDRPDGATDPHGTRPR